MQVFSLDIGFTDLSGSWLFVEYPKNGPGILGLYVIVCLSFPFLMLKTILYFLVECAPLVAFFVVGNIYGFAIATAVNVTLAALIFAYFYVSSGYRSLITIVFTFNVIIAGILSLLFDNPDIFIFSDTLYYAACAGILAWSLRWEKTCLEHLVGHTFALTEAGWRRLTYNWIIVNIICAITNDYVRLFATPEYWIDFQFWRGVAVFLFALTQFYVSHNYRLPEIAGPWGIRTKESVTTSA